MNGKKLVEVNKGLFISVDKSHKIEYVTIPGGHSAWVIKRLRANGFYFAVDLGVTLEAARTKYFEKLVA